jgi:hypothetical protein
MTVKRVTESRYHLQIAVRGGGTYTNGAFDTYAEAKAWRNAYAPAAAIVFRSVLRSYNMDEDTPTSPAWEYRNR